MPIALEMGLELSSVFKLGIFAHSTGKFLCFQRVFRFFIGIIILLGFLKNWLEFFSKLEVNL